MLNLLVFGLMFLYFGTGFQVSTLRCWDCRSDGINASFCGDYLDKDLITDQQRNYVYPVCKFPPANRTLMGVTEVAVCRLMKQTENLTTIVYRGCHYKTDGLPHDCLHGNYPTGIKTEYCVTCSTDGCNAAIDFNLLKNSLLANKGVGRNKFSYILAIAALILTNRRL